MFFASDGGFYFGHPNPLNPVKKNLVAVVLLCSCRKEITPQSSVASSITKEASFKEYVVPKGEHYATDNPLQALEVSALKFAVRFDSSAVYQTSNPENQYDINKLYGFADNGAHHQQFSARFGWRWSDGALRLFAYTYNNGVRDSKELGTVNIGEEAHCSIKINGGQYIFTLNDKAETMLRLSTTEKAKGYQLYPYFGGDEAAPHEVRIWIKNEAGGQKTEAIHRDTNIVVF